MHIPEADISQAQERQLRFKVTTRERAPLRWEILADNIESLERAASLAESVVEGDVAIWVKNEFGNTQYWAKSMPEIYNSVVLSQKYL